METINQSRRKALFDLSGIATLCLLLNGCAVLEAVYKLNKDSMLAGKSDKNVSSLKVTGSSNTGNKIARTALSQIGTRYVLGGTSPSKGFDCSGLLWWACKQNGISIPRITKDQAYAGSAVSLDALKPGDILVFSQPAAPNALHTGMVSSSTKFIHAPNSRKNVTEASLSDPYWVKHLVLARRVV